MKKIKVLSIFLIFFFCLSTVVAAKEIDYVLDEGKRIPIPLTYEVKKVIKNLGEAGFMNHPEGLFIDSEGFIYIADTENHRILKISKEGEVQQVFTEAEGKSFHNPKGVFVDEDGVIWIGDTGNLRIATLYPDGRDRKVYVKPDSPLLENDFTFDPSKIYVNSTGYIYALKGTNLLSMDEQNHFRGFIGAKEVGFNLTRTLIRVFGTKSQKDRTLKQNPDSYTNFIIANDGMIYGTVGNAKDGGQIRKLNSVGKNTYPDEFYGEKTYDQHGILREPNFVDITVADNGIISVLERNLGKVYQYDQEGNLLTVFGGIGEHKGVFQIPSSIATDQEGNIYVLDYNANTLQMFEPTHFIKLIHQAVTLHNDGRYDEALAYWEEVLKIDANYALAHKGIAKVYFKAEQWKNAMDSYQAAGDTEGYSKAFAAYRHEKFRKHFGWIVLGAACFFFGTGKSLAWLKRKSDMIATQIEMGKGEI